MTGFIGPPDPDRTGDVGEDLVDSSTGAPSRSGDIADIRVIASTLADTDPVRQWLNEYADLLERGVGQIDFDVMEDMAVDIIEKQTRTIERQTHSLQMKVRSGNVHDPRPVVAFLYYLARDGMPVGDIEGILIRLRELERDFGEYGFTNGWLARWAQDAAERLRVAPGTH